MEQEDTSDEQPSRLKLARSRFAGDAIVDSKNEDESDEAPGSTQQTNWSAQSGLAAMDIDENADEDESDEAVRSR